MIFRKSSIWIVSFPFGFINVIIFIYNPSGSYSTFVRGDLEYPFRYVLTRTADLSWDTLILNQVQAVMVSCWRFWWSQILVASGGFQDFSRRFLRFKIWKLWTCVRHYFHHYIQCELLLENYCNSLLVY